MREKELTFSSEVEGGILDSSLDYDTLSLATHTHFLVTVKENSFLLEYTLKLCID